MHSRSPYPGRLLRAVASIVSVLVLGASQVVGESPAAGQTADSRDSMLFFESQIRPLLVEHCHDCHAGEASEGGLRLDSAEAALAGGDSGAVIQPGDPEASLLVSAIRYEGLEMPPTAPLSESERADLEKWIASGAHWPEATAGPAGGSGSETDAPRKQQSWWAAEPLDPGAVPAAVAGAEPSTPIDRYIDRALHDAGLRRAPPADRARLIRRLSYDLLGLPPTPAQVDAFVADRRPDAYQRLVDSMLSDPAYGERMARRWLDLVRYAESDGYRQDAYRPHAWRYRQWVTDAFNKALPYDRFVSLQLAGDEIAPESQEAAVAVGFFRLGIYEYNQRDAEGQWQVIVDELTDVTADVFLATGMACAKCHDHKFDPIPRADYFRLRSVFEPLSFQEHWPSQQEVDPADKDKIQRLRRELEVIEGDVVDKIADDAVVKFPEEVQAMYRKPPEKRNSYEHQIAHLVHLQVIDMITRPNEVDKKLSDEAAERREAILQRLRSLGAAPRPEPNIMTVADARAPIRPTRLPGRSQGKAFDPGVPELFGGEDLAVTPPPEAPNSSGRRLALARWITSPENPIAPRVMVNRLWQYHFGTGLVASPNDFGELGERPSHPRLLDYLAKRFVATGWDIKALQREIVTSEAYRQSAVHPGYDEAMHVDAENRLLWHHAVQRLDAEQYRDSLLVAMDRLRGAVGGPSVGGTPPRRSLYLQRKRNTPDEMLQSLDAPTGIVGTARRDVTVTAPQSLLMMNNPRLISVSQRFAERVRRDVADSDPRERPRQFVRRAFRIVASVDPPSPVVDMLAPLAASGSEGEVDVCHVVLNSNQFLFVE